MIWGVIQLLRPKQWIKNLLVGAAPFAAGSLFMMETVANCLLAFAAFCLASSSTYCLNDVMDAQADAMHPIKSSRPVASGTVSPLLAMIMSVVLATTAVALANPAPFRLVIATYLGITVAYSVWLKHQPVLELGLVASGFVLRAIGGGLAADVPLSQWFVIVTAFASMFMVCGKRLSELTASQRSGGAVRRSLAHYPVSYLRSILAVCAGVTIMGYCLWAFEVGAVHPLPIWSAVSVAPFGLAILRYALDADLGRAEEPEEVVLRDPVLQALGGLWLFTFGLGVFLG